MPSESEQSAQEASDEAADELRAPPRRPLSQPSAPLPLRWLFYAVWLMVIPGGLAVAAVRLLEPEALADVGIFRTFIAEQQVPATIMFFTLFAMIVWRVRYVLPFAASVGVLARADIPTRLRGKFDDAVQLLAEARRILVHRTKVERRIGAERHGVIVKALDDLDAVMRAEQLSEDNFSSALAKAEQLVAKDLGRWRKGELREYAESIGVAVAVALVLRFFVIEAFKIPSGSMIPTLMIGDHIFVAKYAYGPLLPRSDTRLYDALPPDRGDVMVFKFPENKQQDFIKRAIALPGDTLEAIDGRPVINGWLVPHCKVGKVDLPHGLRGHIFVEYLGDKSYLTMYDNPFNSIVCKTDRDCGGARVCRGNACGVLQGPYQVKPGEVWVMGDNRDNSHDSRSWNGGVGAGVPFDHIKGRAMFVWWSWDPRGGVAFERIFVNVLGSPTLSPAIPDALRIGLDRCAAERPPESETTPPTG